MLVIAKAGEAARARCSKSRPEGETATSRASGERVEGGSARGPTGYSCSPRTRKGARLVASTVRLGQASISPATSGAAPSTCSKLSSMSRNSFPRRWATSASRGPSVSLRPRARTMVGKTSAGSASGASPTKATPSGNIPSASRAASRARRVLPTPPVPVSVSSRTSGRAIRSLTSSSSRSRPTSGVAGRGKADAGEGAGGAPAAEGAASPRPGTAASSAARPSSSSPRASAKALTVCGWGRLRCPRSSTPTALGERPAREANSSWVRPAASRKPRKRAPKGTLCLDVSSCGGRFAMRPMIPAMRGSAPRVSGLSGFFDAHTPPTHRFCVASVWVLCVVGRLLGRQSRGRKTRINKRGGERWKWKAVKPSTSGRERE